MGAFPPNAATNPTLPHDSRVTHLVGVCSSMLALVTLVVAARTWVRLKLTKGGPGTDDWCILVAWALAVAFDAANIHQRHFGLGQHIYDLPPDIHVSASLELYYFGEWIYYLTVAVTKVAILNLYLRIAVEPHFRRIIWACMIFVIITATGCISASILQCTPIHKAWDAARVVPGSCIKVNTLFFANAGLDIFQDALIYVLPMRMLYQLQIPKRQKVALMMVFAVGGFVVVTGMVRLNSLRVAQNTDDPTCESPFSSFLRHPHPSIAAEWYEDDNYGAAIWSAIESNVGIVCACLPTFKPLIDRFFPGLMGHERRRSSGTPQADRMRTKHGYVRKASESDAEVELERGIRWTKASFTSLVFGLIAPSMDGREDLVEKESFSKPATNYSWQIWTSEYTPPIDKRTWKSPLCAPCRDVASRAIWTGIITTDQYNLSPCNLPQRLNELELSAQGCHFCHLRWRQLSDRERSELKDCNRINYEYIPNTGCRNTDIRELPATLRICYEIEGQPQIGGVLKWVELKAKDEYSIESALSTTNDTAVSWYIARQWLQECMQDHALCRQPSSPGLRGLPTRLIELTSGPLGGRGGCLIPRQNRRVCIKPRVCLASELDTSTQYMTLSHCWGGLTMTTLTSSNLVVFQKKIPIAELTKSFKEAMETTVRLGIRYLWIDCLCIIQDSEDDWKRESGSMGAIYENSFCNIAASNAANGDEGLFTSRTLFDIRPCLVENEDESYGLTCWIYEDEEQGRRVFEEGPLSRRAWVAQESIMSPRILHFGAHQMYWQCSVFATCETSYQNRRKDYQKISMIRESLTADKKNVDYDIWTEAVRRFTAGDLTYPAKDKLGSGEGDCQNSCCGLDCLVNLEHLGKPSGVAALFLGERLHGRGLLLTDKFALFLHRVYRSLLSMLFKSLMLRSRQRKV
ncbi:MAG: hypothetical protein Q9218_005243 [Villophora microphyllina]